ncbi:glucan phosphoethanolaminetransferase (alkaline phosphatase superfamily) [Pseudorhizobium tarimense]|uniref:Glucan phosphoethanolaminetransferase (Alkaline phosphatase superfamily) n=1 Tax=Pseudorhizobium tarimense TaxID=1079109 RepID=A0ABV2H6A6_9HYPH|nr:hypothetical protein [Pseudorhizobium tarimense]MCJ8519091.1 hypothetical protein [Pseudorhizobium tarimense]
MFLKKLKAVRPTIRSEVLSGGVALYLLLVMNVTFWQKSMAYLDWQYLALLAWRSNFLPALPRFAWPSLPDI